MSCNAWDNHTVQIVLLKMVRNTPLRNTTVNNDIIIVHPYSLRIQHGPRVEGQKMYVSQTKKQTVMISFMCV